MNNKVIIGIVVVVLAVAGGWYFVVNKKAPAPMASSTMNQLLASAEPVECVYTQTNEQAQTTGTLYVAGGQVRGDFTVETKAVANAPAQKFESHLITDGKKVLLWPLTPVAPTQGVTVAVDPARKDQVDLDQNFNADCKPWVKDDSKFVAPADIKFTDANVLEQAFEAQAKAAMEAQMKLASTTPAQ